jgi:hypothetical protein
MCWWNFKLIKHSWSDKDNEKFSNKEEYKRVIENKQETDYSSLVKTSILIG